MRFPLLVMAAVILLAACKNENKIPGNVISQEKMEAILWDMMRADQFLTDYVLNKDTSKKKFEESSKLYQQIFAIHNTTKEEFRASFSFYQSHPALLKTIMDSLGKLTPATPRTETIQPVLAEDTVKSKKAPAKDTIKPQKKMIGL